ncbi:hypothetical protein BH11ARM1_BH11ARM1_10010 [soil metagenome]
MNNMDESQDVIGYRVVTESIIVGPRVYTRGQFIPVSEAGKELDYVYGMKLVEPVTVKDEDTLTVAEKALISSTLAFKKP